MTSWGVVVSKRQQLRICRVILPRALVRLHPKRNFSEQLDALAASCYRWIHLSGCGPDAEMKRPAGCRPWGFRWTLNLLWGHPAATLTSQAVFALSRSLNMFRCGSRGSWNTLIIGHPSTKCCYQSVISRLRPSHPRAVAIKFPGWMVYRSPSWGASSGDKMFIMSLSQR